MIIAVDFDGTLSLAGYPDCGNPNDALFASLISARENGDKVILFTCRHDDTLSAAVSFCEGQGLRFDAVNDNLPEIVEEYGDTRKIYADIYIDDKARTPDAFLGVDNMDSWQASAWKAIAKQRVLIAEPKVWP